MTSSVRKPLDWVASYKIFAVDAVATSGLVRRMLIQIKLRGWRLRQKEPALLYPANAGNVSAV